MTEFVAQPRARWLLASVALLGGFALIALLRADGGAGLSMAIFAICLAAVIGAGKLASP